MRDKPRDWRLSSQWDIAARWISRLNSPKTTTIDTSLSRFFSAWTDLGQNPSSVTLRDNVITHAGSVITELQGAMSKLVSPPAGTSVSSLDSTVKEKLAKVNTLAQSVVDFNDRITAAVAAGGSARRETIDGRNQALVELSRLSGATYTEPSNAAAIVSIGAFDLVGTDPFGAPGATKAYTLATAISGAADGHLNVVQASDPTITVALTSGELFTGMTSRNADVASQIASLNNFANDLIGTANAQHALGFDSTGAAGGAFFGGAGGGVAGITLAATSANLAASTGASPLDGNNARTIGQLSAIFVSKPIVGTFSDMITRLGAETRHAGTMADNLTILNGQVETQRESISGVSLDEESANLVKYQRAYQASARVINAVDEMLDLIINRMGMVGR